MPHQLVRSDEEIARQDDLRPLLNIGEVATLLGVSVRHVRRLVFEDRIPYLKWGRLLRFDRSDLSEWLDTMRRHP